MHVLSQRTAANKGYLTPATDVEASDFIPKYHFDKTIYDNRVFDSKGVADPSVEIQFGPNIKIGQRCLHFHRICY